MCELSIITLFYTWNQDFEELNNLCEDKHWVTGSELEPRQSSGREDWVRKLPISIPKSPLSRKHMNTFCFDVLLLFTTGHYKEKNGNKYGK